MTKLEQMIRNYGKNYTITTNTLKRYFDEDLIDSLICFDEVPCNRVVNASFNADGTLHIWSYERNSPNGTIDIIDEKLCNVIREVNL